MKGKAFWANIAIALFAALLFIPGIGGYRLFDWDEINFAESAREMILTGNWFDVQINFESFWEKPPLFIWAQALSMKVFGVNEFAARFPNALMGIITLLVLFNIGRKTEDFRFGLIWAGMYCISFLPFFYFKSGIIDPWFNLGIFLGIYFFSRYSDPGAAALRARHAALSALFMGLAILTKGPVAFLIFCLTVAVWLIFRRFRFSFRWKDVGIYFLVLALAGGAWFIALAATGHSYVIKDFIDYQIRLFQTKDAGHGGFFLYHFIILLIGAAPASVFAIPALVKMPGQAGHDAHEGHDGHDAHSEVSAGSPSLPASTGNLYPWMLSSFWVVLILFTIVRTKIVHYSSFCYFPLSFLATCAATRMADGKLRFRNYQGALIIGVSVFFGALLAFLANFDSIKEYIVPFVKDPFAVSCMEAVSDWNGFEPLAGVILIACSTVFCLLFRRRADIRRLAILAAGNLIFAMTVVLCAVPQVEKYSQASAIDFYIERQGEDCYVKPAFFKSYAQYFYTDRQPGNTCADMEWLGKGPIDKPCYFVIKDTQEYLEKLAEAAPDAKYLYKRSGFVFFVRECQTEKVQESQQQEQDGDVEE